MRKHNIPPTTSSPDSTVRNSELPSMNHKLLVQLALAVAANEETQRRFRTAVLIKLSNIETMAHMIHGAQIVDAHGQKPGFEEKVREHAGQAEEFIAQKGKQMGIAMVKFIYGEHEKPEVRHDQRRKWYGWEI